MRTLLVLMLVLEPLVSERSLHHRTAFSFRILLGTDWLASSTCFSALVGRERRDLLALLRGSFAIFEDEGEHEHEHEQEQG